jgi:hypothetical protein
MARTHIPLKFKQIALDNFPNIPDDAPIVQLIAIAGSKEDVSVAVVKTGLDWLETNGEVLELKDGVTPGKGLKRLCSCLAMAIALGASEAIEQAQKPKTAPPKPTRKPEQKDSN